MGEKSGQPGYAGSGEGMTACDPIIKAYQSGMTSKQMGMTFGMNSKEIYIYLREHYIPKRPGRHRVALKKIAKAHKFRSKAGMLQPGSGWVLYKMNIWHERQLTFVKGLNRRFAVRDKDYGTGN